ncbi:MAG: tetratricopeptide repeat protein, partial [Desulfobacteraceae bacterium]
GAPKIEPASREKMAFPLPDKPSIAVLPFANMSGDPQQDFFSDGITENIITGLSQLNALFVIARNSTFTYKGKPVKVQQVAEDLGVRYILEGSVQKSGERLRITAQFIDALKGHHLWSERYDRDLKDLFAIEDDITKKIMTALQVILTQGEQARLIGKGTENLDAYLKCMEAREHLFRFNRDANLVARQKAEEAISLDPKYSTAHAILGKTYTGAVFFGWTSSPKDALGNASASATKALALDASDFQARQVLAFVHLLRREHDKAVEECERAVSLAPSAADPVYSLGVILRFAGRVKEAIPAFERAIRLNPIPPASYLYQLALSHTFVGDFEKAIRLCNEALPKNPDDLIGRVTLVIAYGSLGRDSEARAQVSELLRVDPKFSLDQAAKTWPYKKTADREFVLAALRKAGLSDKPQLPLPDKPSIAVLPFANMSGDPKQEYLCDGITESIITAVSKIHNLFVIARNSTFAYKGKAVNIQQAARELGVQYVLEGSVQRSGDRLRITAQLIDALSGRHMWAQKYDRELKDLFAVQDDITMEILQAMRVKLSEGQQVLQARRPKNIESATKAYEAHGYVLVFTPEANDMGRKLAEEVIAMEPDWGEAYYILSEAHMMEVWLGTSKSPKESLDKAIALSEKAVSLDDSLSQAYALIGYLYGMKREHDKSVAYAEKAVEMDPNGADARVWLANCLSWAARPQEAIPHYEMAMRLNPNPPQWYYINLGACYTRLGRYEESVAQMKKALVLSPNSVSAWSALIVTYGAMGKEDEARAAAAELLRINPKFSAEQYLKTSPSKGDYPKLAAESMRKAGLLK